MKKQMKYGLAAVLLGLAGMTLLSGCQKKETKEIGQENADKVKLEVLVEGAGMPASSDEDPILDALNERLNMDMNFSVVQNEYSNQLNVRVAGGNPPDLFSLNYEQMHTYAEQDLLLDWTPYLDQMPRVQEVLKQEDWVKGMVNGKIVALSKRPFIKLHSLWVRKDWLDALGLEVPKTLEDLVNVSVAFTKQDPDGNGVDDTYGFTAPGMTAAGSQGLFGLSPVFGAFGTTQEGQFYVKDGKAVYSTEDPAFRDAIEFIRSFIATGSVDPELVVNKNFSERDKAFRGEAGIIYIAWTDMVKGNLQEQMKAVNPDAEWIQIEPPAGPGGSYDGFIDLGDTPNRYAMPKDIAPEKRDQVLKLMDYIAGGEGLDLVCYGVEGVHYKKEEDQITALPAMSDITWSYNYQLVGRDDVPYYGVKYPTLTEYRDFAYGLDRINVYTNLIQILDKFNIVDLRSYEQQELVNFIYGKRDMDEFDDFLKTLEDTYHLSTYKAAAESTLKECGYIK